MKPEQWQAIDAIRQKIDLSLEPALWSLDKPKVTERIGELSSSLAALVRRAHEVLVGDQFRHTEHILLLLVCFADERAIRRLPSQYRSDWPWLQSQWLGTTTGGRVFYETLEVYLQDSNLSRVPLQVAGYCLANDFRGELAGDDVKRREVSARLDVALAASQATEQDRSTYPNDVAVLSRFPSAAQTVYAVCAIGWVITVIAFSYWK